MKVHPAHMSSEICWYNNLIANICVVNLVEDIVLDLGVCILWDIVTS